MRYLNTRWLPRILPVISALILITASANAADPVISTSDVPPGPTDCTPFDLVKLRDGAEIPSEIRGTGAVLLRKEHTLWVDAESNIVKRIHLAIQVVDDKACRDYANISIPFNAYYQDMCLDFARVLSPNDRVRDVKRDAVQVSGRRQGTEYSESKSLRFSLPTMAPGAVLEFQFSLRDKENFIPGHWDNESAFNYVQFIEGAEYPRIDPVLVSQVQVFTPVGYEINSLAEDCSVEPTVEQQGGLAVHTWRAGPLPAVPVEIFSVAAWDYMPSINIWTQPSWQTVEAWAAGLFAPASTVTPAIAGQAQEATRGLKSEREIIETLFYFVQDEIRYVSADWGRSGVTPDSAETVLDNGYGDCKDQAALLIALLKARGISAYPALVNHMADEVLDPKVPTTDDFSHCICYVPLADGDLWLDTSPDNSQFPGMNWMSQGRWALICGYDGATLVRIPEAEPAENEVHVEVSFALRDSIAVGTLDVRATGTFSFDLAAAVTQSVDRNYFMAGYLQSIYPAARFVSAEYPGLNESRSPFHGTAVFELPYGRLTPDVKTFPYQGNLMPLVPFAPILGLPLMTTPRKTDMILGAPCRLIFEHSCPAPDWDFVPGTLSPPLHLTSPGIEFHREYQANLSGVDVRLEVVIQKSVLQAAEVQEFQDGWRNMLKNGEWQVVYYR